MSPLPHPPTGLPPIIDLLRAGIHRYRLLLHSVSEDQEDQAIDGASLSTLGFSFAALGRLINAHVETSSPLSEFDEQHAEARQLALANFLPVAPKGVPPDDDQ